MSLKIRRESALNLTIEGSIGSFRVGKGREGQNSIEVKYFLTHVGLDFSSSANEALLSHLAPVREIFDLNQLDFDEIMQRDIDDARVSSELIPYLLDEKSVDLVKLFPPIVVVVLPVNEGENRPAKLYPTVTTYEKPETEEEGQYILRSGSIGQEVFQFEQPISEGQKLQHDLVRFKLNTHKTRLVIVDGQHRAMALLALYRNLKDQWSDEKRAPFKEYYSEWTPKYIQKFNLKEINLPIILCTFPSLDEQYSGEFDLRKAARTVFLTLNREARKVSRTRNILLDDNDIIAYFLRSYLSKVKQKDQRSSSSLRISNIELDQSDKDKLKIESPIAITGVSHLYYIIEHLLLNNGSEVKGAKPRSGNFAKRKDLNLCMQKYRLNGRNLLGSEMADSTKRDNFTIAVAEKLREQFDEKYGHLILAIFEGFILYENHNKAVLDLEQKIESYQDRQLKPILFEGQGISRVFDAHRENLKNKIQETELSNIPEIQSITQRLDATAKRVNKAVEDFRYERANLCIKLISDKAVLKNSEGNISDGVVQWFSNDLYDNILKTVAFQSGLICGFWGEIEKISIKLEEDLNFQEYLEEYIEQLNNFFIPHSSSQLKKLVHIFTGEIVGDISDWKIIPTNYTFRNIVYRGEMQPDQWTKYKYLILEIWHPTNEFLENTINEEREKCREQIFSALYNLYKSEYCKENSKFEDNLDEDEKNIIFNKTFAAYNMFLKNVNKKSLDQQKMKRACSVVPASEIDESEAE
ncbi:DNA sulfur modification protein DndB [Nodularia spumigena CS-586/05]|uniref:DNA sulfur modification protein DndB n=1 Tax=Nodularia spumigena TaxID=70799 RepID=UPI00232CE0EF|nr:DNA sulfur modification protein DndB [Nodularia spumigena]MDB9344935.1 DNA sulfur modification protein DndB [Nodularia spumigena CS-588/06]MDB9367564.1 DNA sulfur modification protein DndB [Nodularia spumigena CS-586/05]